MHAIDPLQALRLLRHRLADLTETEFHVQLQRIFLGLHDLHTNYILPVALRRLRVPRHLPRALRGRTGGRRTW